MSERTIHSESESGQDLHHLVTQEKMETQKTVIKGVHGRLRDFGCIHQLEIMSCITSGQDGRTGIERITGETPDILE